MIEPLESFKKNVVSRNDHSSFSNSWGDFGVNIIIAEGKVIEAYGGD